MRHYLQLRSSSRNVLLPFLLLTLFLTATLPFLYGQAPVKLWDKTIGGNADDRLYSLQQTSDEGYILGGYSDSGVSGDKSEKRKSEEHYSGGNFWVVKTDASGNKQWDKTFGGKRIPGYSGDNYGEYIKSLQQTSDGGYVLGGTTYSTAGFDKSEVSRGDADFWVVKTDASGNKQWNKTIGGNRTDVLNVIKQTKDGGYILSGYSNSEVSGDKSEDWRNGVGWIVKLSATGDKEWDKTYFGNGRYIQQTTDGGYIVDGLSAPAMVYRSSTYFVMKLNAVGEKEWDKILWGDSYSDAVLLRIQQTTDGGYILGGYSNSNAGLDKSENSKGDFDYWVVKLDNSGNRQWDKTIGGDGRDVLHALQQTRDGGYILGGNSNSNARGDKSEKKTGEWDYWAVKLDASGNKQWDKTIGGNYEDQLHDLQQTKDGGYIFGGYSNSNAGLDKSENRKNQGYYDNDYCIVKLSADAREIKSPITSLILINADIDSYVGELKSGDIIDLVTLGNPLLNVRANAEVKLDSVIFELSGSTTTIRHIERHLPYVLYGDGLKAGAIDYWGDYWKPGQYTLKATPYLQGKADNSYSVNFEITGNLPPALRVNFGKSHTPAPKGWQTDYGLAFGEKNSYSYGWKRRDNGTPVDLSVGGTLPGNGRWRPLPKDLLLSTLMHMQSDDVPNFNGTPVESYWELALENGDYQVTVSVGDGSVWITPESHSINVEGEKAIDNFVPQGTEGSISRFKQASIRVSVRDGHLTINADGGANTKINYVIIQPLFSTAAIASGKENLLLQTDQAQPTSYPNPFSDKFSLAMHGWQGNVFVVLQDLTGNVYYRCEQQIESSLLPIDVSSVELRKGFYLLTIIDEHGKSSTLKLLKN
ncbi:T9SS type A sorting domain-containing protein [Rhodocytophaga aerolata]|uniref:T9SS type A sorting domain-containing protein n=1 Tax=Rhodocytophaga aerolata TaxID=455078 RepID=A0ABT8RH40_9BACT|nr:T9SS type A sorting domain-containing protein [Rhodocytophaga aerolata]MDO1450478.1 T9SS type A sorting domain-containing protein [Rhodocytophaga aerolata]